MRERAYALLTVVASLTTVGPSLAQDTAGVPAEVDAVQQKVDELERRYLVPALLEQEHKLTARVSDGQLFYLQRDYDRAAMVLLDVVETPASRNHPAYRDALFYLADSLFRTRNFNAARDYFEQVIDRGSSAQKQQALARLLEIALITRDPVAAQRYLARANAAVGATPEPSLLYALGKYHYRTGGLRQAIGMFGRIPGDANDYLRARYFMGVSQVRLKAYGEALLLFNEVVDALEKREGALSREEQQVVDMGRLAIARLHYERGEFEKAVAAYAAVPRESASFDEALYESVWISIKQGSYEKALRKLEVQLISQPDVLRGPDSRLLQGKLLMMLGRFDDASQAFQEVLFEFGPLHDEMKDVVKANRGDLESYFNRLIGENIENFDLTSFLPERAAEFAGPDVRADRALLLVSDLAAQKRDVNDARRTIEKLDAALAADSRVQIFPRLHDGWLQALEARARLTTARARLNDAAARKLGATKPAEYRKLKAERERWAERFAKVPRTVVDLRARSARVDDKMARLDRLAHELEVELGGVEAQLVAIRKYLADTARAVGPAPKDIAARQQMQAELANNRRLRDQVQRLKQTIEVERLSVGANDKAAGFDSRVRARYLSALAAEDRWLSAQGQPPPAAALRRIDALEKRLSAFFRRASTLVEERVAEIKRQVDRERANVGSYDGELVSYRGETESLGGAIAARSFKQVLGRIDGVVLEADVGLIDVAWKQKDDKSKSISKLLERKRFELQTLDRNFAEVTGE